MIQLTEDDLEKLGVQALGARRKLAKMFTLVRDAIGELTQQQQLTSSHATMVEGEVNGGRRSNDERVTLHVDE